jgi:hypothetical protein
MAGRHLRDSANRKFEIKSDSQRRAAAATQEREAAAREIRAKTERLKALRLAKEEADRVAHLAASAEQLGSEKS